VDCYTIANRRSDSVAPPGEWCLFIFIRFFEDGGSNGPTSGCTKSKIRPPAILENFEWPYLWNGLPIHFHELQSSLEELWTPSRPFLSPLLFPPFSFPSFPSAPLSPSPPGWSQPLITAARESGGALKLPQRGRAEPGRQAFSGAFWAKKSNSGYSNVALRLTLVRSHSL